jgi:hypothetical protein
VWRAKAGSLSGGSRETAREKARASERARERETERDSFRESGGTDFPYWPQGGGERVGNRSGKYSLGESTVNNTCNSTAAQTPGCQSLLSKPPASSLCLTPHPPPLPLPRPFPGPLAREKELFEKE